MNLIRLIKLKKINGELNNLTDPEKFFISLFDNLYLDTISKMYTHVNSNDYYFKYSKATNEFYTSSIAFFVFHEEYGYTWDEYNNLVSEVFYSKLGITLKSKILSKFSNGGLTPVEDPKSNCFGCTADMCDHEICRGDMYYWYRDNVKE